MPSNHYPSRADLTAYARRDNALARFLASLAGPSPSADLARLAAQADLRLGTESDSDAIAHATKLAVSYAE